MQKTALVSVAVGLSLSSLIYLLSRKKDGKKKEKHSQELTDGLQLTPERMNTCIKTLEYAVRGELVLKAFELEEQLKKQKSSDEKKLPFDEIIHSNLGNPHALGQRPITFVNQILSLLNAPHLLEQEERDEDIRSALRKLFPGDAIERAKILYKHFKGGLGAYTHSKGAQYVRQSVAAFIERRDGFPSDAEEIFLTNGASPGIQHLLNLLIRDKDDAILIPNPQYPLYTASIQGYGGTAVCYRLDESLGWSFDMKELEKVVTESKKKGLCVRAMVVINPGNPTGQCLLYEDIAKVIKFCAKHRIVLLADEVYQDNSYDPGLPFHSFKKVVRQLEVKGEIPRNTPVELVSFHSVSKGMLGECGRRGGYFELYNIHPEINAQLYKLASVSLSPNSTGQAVVELMVNPPKKGEESYPLWEKEMQEGFQSLKRRADKLVTAFRKMEGMSCTPVTGALYAFPRITIPPRAVAAAKEAGKEPDMFYCLELLQHTGICLVPGSGFKPEKEDVYHFRTTILPREDKIDGFIQRLGDFHAKFMDRYR